MATASSFDTPENLQPVPYMLCLMRYNSKEPQAVQRLLLLVSMQGWRRLRGHATLPTVALALSTICRTQLLNGMLRPF